VDSVGCLLLSPLQTLIVCDLIEAIWMCFMAIKYPTIISSNVITGDHLYARGMWHPVDSERGPRLTMI
jgi:hypothetical protein